MNRMYTDDELSSYKKFAEKTHIMSDSDLFKANNGFIDDELTSEMKDIVAWEIRIREIEFLKSKGINMEKAFSYKKANSEVKYISPDNTMDGTIAHIGQKQERKFLSEMNDDLLKKSLKIIDENPTVIDEGDNINTVGRGINVMTKKFMVRCNNGNLIEFDNHAIQEHFRKEYVKRMSEVTGIDYTQYDLNSNSDLNGDYSDITQIHISNSSDNPDMTDIPFTFSDNEYEDD